MSSEEIAKKYRLLFRLPSYNKILLGITVVSSVFGIMHGIGRYFFIKDNVLWNILMFTLGYYMIPALLSIYVTGKIIRRETLTDRRLAGLSLFTVIFMGISNIIGVTMSMLTESLLVQEAVTIISCGIITALKYLVVYALEKQKFKAVLSSLFHYTPCILVGIWIYELVERYGILKTILRCIYVAGSFTIISWFLMEAINKVGLKTMQIGGIEVFNAFTTYWLANKKDKIEAILEKCANKKDVKIKSIVFFDEKDQIRHALIVPEFHFGPFRDLGSSQFPHLIMEQLNKIEINGIILHGISEHGQDIAKNNDCKRIIDKVTEEICKSKPDKRKATAMIKVKRGKCTVYCQIFEDTALLIVTRAPNLTEDLPLWVKEKIKSFTKQIGIEDIIIVDAHNSINENEQLSKKDFEEIIETSKEAITRAKERKLEKLRVGVNREKIREYNERQGIGKGGIIGLTLSTETDKYTFIIFDGNNMIPNFREKVIKNLASRLYPNIEVLTTDTHSVNGLTPEERGYHPIGEKDPKDILVKYAFRVAKKSKEQMIPIKYTIKETIVKDVKILGEDMLTKFSKAINEAIKIIRKVAITGFTLSYVTSIILFLI